LLLSKFDAIGGICSRDSCSTKRAARNQGHHTPRAERGAVDGSWEQASPVAALYREDGLLVLRVIFEPRRTTVPHNHRTWSVVGIYRGQEDNKLFRRARKGGIELTTGRSLTAGEILALGPGAIHSICNPRSEPLIALHVYGADLFDQGITEWDPATMIERATSFPPTMRFG